FAVQGSHQVDSFSRADVDGVHHASRAACRGAEAVGFVVPVVPVLSTAPGAGDLHGVDVVAVGAHADHLGAGTGVCGHRPRRITPAVTPKGTSPRGRPVTQARQAASAGQLAQTRTACS